MRKMIAKTQSGLNHFVFIVIDVEWEPFTKGKTIAQTLAENNVWLASKTMPYRRDYKSGDLVLFYVAGRGARCFIGQAVIGDVISNATNEDISLADNLGLRGFTYRIPLSCVNIWDNSVYIKPIVESIEFIKDKKNYGLNLRKPSAIISAHDFDFIVNESKRAEGNS